jgi:hypothetical protein
LPEPTFSDQYISIDLGSRYIPVTDYTNKNLTDDDAANLEVVHRSNPGGVADRGFASPTSGESLLEERLDVSD